MERWQNHVAVVTGASTGIGAAITKDLLKQGLIVAALARRKELIEDYRQKLPIEQQKRLYAIRTDISNKESVDEAFDWITKELGGIDILVNNAGIIVPGQLSTLDIESINQIVQVNVIGLIYATQRAVKSLKERDVEGHVVHINSRLGHMVPNYPVENHILNVYPATKHAVTAITEVLRQEFGEWGGKVKVTSVSPGLTDTDVVPQQIKNSVSSMLKPEDISSAVVFALSTPQHVQVSEILLQPNPSYV